MISRGENYLSSGYLGNSPNRDVRRWSMILGSSGSNYWNGSMDQQLRRAGHNIFRYFRNHVCGPELSYTQWGNPIQAEVESYWTNVLKISPDAEAGGAFCHTSSPTHSGNRTQYAAENLRCLRFASASVLEYLYGSDATGIRRSDGQPGEFLGRILWEKGIKYLFFDTFIPSSVWTYSGSNPEELRYAASVAAHEEAWYEMCQALRDRLRIPKNIKIVVNYGSHSMYPGQPGGGGSKTFKDFLEADFYDGIYRENLMDKSYPWYDPSKPQFWYSHLLIELYKWRMLFNAGKFLIGESALLGVSRFSLYYTGSASPKTYAYNQVNKRLTVTLGSNVFNYDITQSSTWGDILSFLQSCKDQNNIYLQVTSLNDDKINWNLISPYTYMYQAIPVTTISASAGYPSYLRLPQTPRESLVTVAAAIALAAPGPNGSKAYIIGATNEGTFYDCDLFDAFPLLGQPDFSSQPLRTEYLGGYPFQASWDRVNENWGHVYYRLFSNGVAFLNWTDTDREISANDARWGSRSLWYPMSQRVNGEYNVFVHPTDRRTQATSSVTVRAKSGEICLFGV